MLRVAPAKPWSPPYWVRVARAIPMATTTTGIRQATLDDVPPIAQLHVVAWQVAYRGCIPDSYLDGLDPQRRALGWQDFLCDSAKVLLVALRDQGVAGFVALVPSRDPDARPETAEIAALYVDPQCWRAGHGSALLDAAVQAARARDYRDLTLWVLASNHRARSFYEARGFARDGQEKTDERPGFSLLEVRYSRSLASQK